MNAQSSLADDKETGKWNDEQLHNTTDMKALDGNEGTVSTFDAEGGLLFAIFDVVINGGDEFIKHIVTIDVATATVIEQAKVQGLAMDLIMKLDLAPRNIFLE